MFNLSSKMFDNVIPALVHFCSGICCISLTLEFTAVMMSCACQSVKRSDHDSLPEGFLLGVATASYQIEGAWDEDGKSPNIWDTLTHRHPEYIADGSTGDVACDSYHKYKEDIQMCKELGAQIYRFSISWCRILPRGLANEVNQAGVDYYNNLIDGLLANGIQPMVTMYHWDLPQVLQDLGGWTNIVLAQYFTDYAKILFTKFGDRVKWWITFNEPLIFISGYSMKIGFAPCLGQPGIADLLSAKTVLIAHARVYHLYNDEFRAKQQGKVGITNVTHWAEPFSDSQQDKQAFKRILEFSFGLYVKPIYSTEGDFPELVKEIIRKNSQEQGHPTSRLPALSREEVQYVRGTADFFGLNHYTTVLAKDGTSTGNDPIVCIDGGIETTQDPSWSGAASCWLKVVPWGFRKILNYISKEYNNPEIFVTENGYSDRGELDDKARINYYSCYLADMLKAIHEDGCRVIGYTAWSLMDNFEWNMGYTEKFGLYYVDFNDPERKRIPKQSCKLFQEIAKTRKIPGFDKMSL